MCNTIKRTSTVVMQQPPEAKDLETGATTVADPAKRPL